MKTAQKRIVRIYTPLSWSVSLDTFGTQLGQTFKEDELGDAAYVPNRRLTPTVLCPVTRVRDADGIFRTGIANDLLADMHWYDGDKELIMGVDYALDNSNTIRRGTLTIYRNTPSGASQTLRFEAVVPDTRRGENVKVYADGISLSTTDVAKDKYEVVADISSSYLYDPTTGVDTLTINASAFRGTKGAVVIDYQLRKIVNSVERAITASDHEVTSIAASRFVLNPRLIQSNQYVIVGTLSGREVGRYLFSVTRKYPVWEAHQAGAADMEPGQVRVSDSVTVTATGVIANQDEYFSIQPHTETNRLGDLNWGERSKIDINAMNAGFEEGGTVGIYFEINELPCMEVAIDDDGSLFLDDDGGKLIV